MQFDGADLQDTMERGTLDSMILHEMGHVSCGSIPSNLVISVRVATTSLFLDSIAASLVPTSFPLQIC